MGSSLSVDQFTSELSKRGVEVDGVDSLVEDYLNNRHVDESKLYRDNAIALVKQFDIDIKDEKIGKSLLALSEKVKQLTP
jgi:hypothetical protein